MASVLNRTTKEYHGSANTPDYDPSAWIINPDLSAVSGFPSKYWIISGDVVSLMDQSARDALDAAELHASRDQKVNSLTNNEDLVRAVALRIIDEFSVHVDAHNELLSAIQNASSFAEMKTSVSGFQNLTMPTVPEILSQVRAKIGVEV